MQKLYFCKCDNFAESTYKGYQIAPKEEVMGNVSLVVASEPEEARYRYQTKMLSHGRCNTMDIEVQEVESVDGYYVLPCRDPLRAIRREEVIKPRFVFSQNDEVPNMLVCMNCNEVLCDDEIRNVLANPALHKRFLLNYTYCPYCGQRIR